jgi:hypothetical protein
VEIPQFAGRGDPCTHPQRPPAVTTDESRDVPIGLWTLRGPGVQGECWWVAWFLRAIEQDDGRWACRHGLQHYAVHAELHHAVEHLRVLAIELGPAELFAHHLDGRIETIGNG